MPAFELSKWYADCVGEEGDAVIVYHAELQWRALAIHYASLLARGEGRPAHSRFSLRQQPPPVVRADRIEWKSPPWRAEGTWCEAGPGIREILLDSPAGSVEWNCLAPRSAAAIRIGSGRPRRGWGYVERLRLSLPPWRMPIRLLRWGRFVNATDALVWIDWCGPYTKRVVYLNGLAVAARTISDREVSLAEGGAVLSLDTPAVLREGVLGATALSVIPHFERIFPARVLGIRECKWLSRAVLRRPGQPDSAGWAIHEVVEWP